MLTLPPILSSTHVQTVQEIAGRNTTLYSVVATFIGLIALYLVIKAVYWSYQGWLLTKYPGYIVPAKSKFAERACKVIAGLFTSSMIGPVKVIGAENASYGGPTPDFAQPQPSSRFCCVRKSPAYLLSAGRHQV
ncbi:MAG: hypothetical protein IPL73_19300 [Candidatus Obscuribacter sp.]|nr:hypothetical protein [Candidatus Obscuribacter sp.]